MTSGPSGKELAELALFPEMNPGPVLRFDARGTILMANNAARRLFGDENLPGKSWLGLCPKMTPAVWASVLQGPGVMAHENEINGKCMRFDHVRPGAGDFVFVYGADITELRRQERKLADQAAQLAGMARFPEMNPGPVFRLDYESKVLLANAAARDIFGEDLLGKLWHRLCPGIQPVFWGDVLGTDEMMPLEIQIKDKYYVFAHRREKIGRLVFVYGADISKQKLAERALRQTEKMATLGTLAAGVAHELNNPAAATRRAAEQLRQAFARLEEANLGLGRLTPAPEGRQALTALQSRASEMAVRVSGLSPLARADREAAVEEWLEKAGLPDPWDLAPALVGQGLDPGELDRLAARFAGTALAPVLVWAARVYPVFVLLHEIGQGSARISEVVGALKNYSYLGQAPVQAVDLHEGLDNTLVILRNKLKAGIVVRREYGADVPRIQAYGSELNQVWTNILDNAADAMGGRGEIVIRTRRAGENAVVEIEDNGPGILEEIQSRIFDPFFTTKAPGKGTGLGLSTSYGIVTEKHKGEIRVASRPGQTRFTITLPLGGPPA